VDVALIPENPALSLHDELRLQSDLARACGRTVDLVRLDHAPTLVRWQVARHGVLLLASGPFEASRFIASAAADYIDFAPALEVAGERFRQRLAKGVRKVP
jgi:hypothetical protein